MPKCVYLYYKGYDIEYAPESYLPRSLWWSATHQDYDGGYYESDGTLSDETDPRHYRGASIEECREEIDWLEDR